jgi:KDO2-lipid IV(A) lauroyltransferase
LDSYLVYALTRFILFLFRIAPRRFGRSILNGLAAIAYHLDATHRHIAEVNLAIAFPEFDRSKRDRIARRSFQNVAQNLLEVAKLSSLNRDNIGSLVRYDPDCGLNNLEAAQVLGKPILYLTGHFSAWELLPAAHALYGHPLSFVTRPLDSAPLEKYLAKVRQSCGNVVISKKNAVRQILGFLKRGDSVGILMDHNTITLEGEFIDLFGLPAPTTTGLALLALRTGATVLPGYLTPMRQARYWIKFLPPLELIRTGDKDKDILENTRMFNQVIERIVRDQPESWLWGHKRWKYQPADNPQDLYSLTAEELQRFLAVRQIRRMNGCQKVR